MINTCYYLLSEGQKSKAFLITLLLFFASIAEVFGVAAILPLADLFLNSDSYNDNKVFKIFQLILPPLEKPKLINWIMILLSGLILSSFILRASSAYLMLRFALAREHYISSVLMKTFLWKKYPWYFDKNKSDLKKITISEVNTVVNGGLISVLILLTQTTVTICILIVLLIVNINVTVIAVVVCVVTYLLLYAFVKKPLLHFGGERLKSNELRFKILDNALRNPKVVQVNKLESKLHKEFSSVAWRYAYSQIIVQTIKMLPRYILEFLAFIILLICLILSFSSEAQSSELLPSFALFIFAGYRVLPSVQQIYAAKAQLDASTPSINQIMMYLQDFSSQRDEIEVSYIKPFHEKISLQRISYGYDGHILNSLNCFSDEIMKGQFVGIKGSSGSGKTTLLDLLMGLLEPVSGRIMIDNQILDKNSQLSWLDQLSYVTQEIVIFNQSLIDNITMAPSGTSIDEKNLYYSWHVACVDEFAQLKDTIVNNEMIGDEGIKLSGGQRQRIALARALYQKPAVLILDEATSALDKNIQSEFVERLIKNKGDMTILMVTHDPEMISYCDKVIDLN